MRRALPLLAMLALAGCGSEPVDEQAQVPARATPAAPAPAPTVAPAPPPVAPAPASAAPQLPSPATLAGEWRVVGIDGQDFNEPYGLGLSGNDTEIWWEPRCAAAGRRYAIKGNGVRFTPRAGAASKACKIAPPPRLADVLRALDSGRTIVITPSNGIEISGGGHSVVLFSQ